PSYSETVEKNVYVEFEVENLSSQTVHVVAVWVIHGGEHTRYDASTTPSFDYYLGPGQKRNLRLGIAWKEGETYTFKLVTERGRIFTVSATALEE
ncbi:MAG: hypothetical protein DRO52_01955, partial [Candidatus Hecatellales archaeon]